MNTVLLKKYKKINMHMLAEAKTLHQVKSSGLSEAFVYYKYRKMKNACMRPSTVKYSGGSVILCGSKDGMK